MKSDPSQTGFKPHNPSSPIRFEMKPDPEPSAKTGIAEAVALLREISARLHIIHHNGLVLLAVTSLNSEIQEIREDGEFMLKQLREARKHLAKNGLYGQF